MGDILKAPSSKIGSIETSFSTYESNLKNALDYGEAICDIISDQYLLYGWTKILNKLDKIISKRDGIKEWGTNYIDNLKTLESKLPENPGFSMSYTALSSEAATRIAEKPNLSSYKNNNRDGEIIDPDSESSSSSSESSSSGGGSSSSYYGGGGSSSYSSDYTSYYDNSSSSSKSYSNSSVISNISSISSSKTGSNRVSIKTTTRIGSNGGYSSSNRVVIRTTARRASSNRVSITTAARPASNYSSTPTYSNSGSSYRTPTYSNSSSSYRTPTYSNSGSSYRSTTSYRRSYSNR